MPGTVLQAGYMMEKKTNITNWEVPQIMLHTHVYITTTQTSHSDGDGFFAQLWLTLCDAMDCSLPGSSVHGISHAGILEQVAISFSRGSSQARDQTQLSCSADRFFTK